jgi:hypothetical protein
MKRLLLFAGTFALAAVVRASTPSAWEMNSYRDFIAGRLSGLSLTRDGRLQLGPKLDTLFASGQPIIWSVVQAADGTLYAATGHRGRVYRIDASGNSSLLWTADQPEVFALALDRKGAVYAATSPDGKIYRIENGKAAEYYAPGAKYIWSLAFGPDGALYAGTGSEGRIYRIGAAGQGEVYYDSGQSHITCLAFDAQGRLLAGSEPNGILYRVISRGKAFALYDSNLPEIRAIIPAPDGAVYAAALGGSLSRRSLGGVMSNVGVPASAAVSATATTVTVEADEQQPGPGLNPKPEQAKPPVQSAPAAQAITMMEVSGIEKSAIYRINPDNTVETLWSSKDENAYDLMLEGPDIVFATDAQGRVYRLNGARQAALVAQTNEGEAVRLLAGRAGLLAATGDAGKLYRLAGENTAAGTYESPVYDAGAVARWGRLSWLGELPDGARIAIRTRSGNSLRPDPTWSDWSEALTNPSGAQVTSPNARYIQWKAELSGPAARGPSLDSVTLAYLPQNTAPAVRSVTVLAQPAAQKAAQQAQPSSAPAAAYTVTVSDSGDAATASTGTPTQQLSRAGADQIQITWQADDPEGDRLAYALYFRGEGEREWKLLKDNLSENSYVIDADALADGKYFFRVVASDGPANSPAAARQAELVSSPTLIDHTPPVVALGTPKRSGAQFELDFEAADAASPIRRCEYAIDAGPWTPIDPVDGIPDSPRERFSLKLAAFPAGEHLLVVRAVDSANNAGLAKVLVK